MNDYPPEVYALIEGAHDSGYSIVSQGSNLWAVVFRCQVVRERRTLEQACGDVARYCRLTSHLGNVDDAGGVVQRQADYERSADDKITSFRGRHAYPASGAEAS